MQKVSDMRRSGFSLIELSIVLVILGLLVGGILGGQSLIRAAELRSITTDLNNFQTAINIFKEKYNALPGDMPTATTYWTAANSNNETCRLTERAANLTCNGNGNNVIEWGNIVWGYGSAVMEAILSWQHLSLAGLVPGNFTGYASGSESGYHVGVTAPRSKISGSGWTLGNPNGFQPVNYLWQGSYKTNLLFTSHSNAPDDIPGGAVLTPEEAYNIDSKIDDGKPGTGTVRTFLAYFPGCASSTTYTDTATATYALNITQSACGLFFDLGF